MKALKKTYCRTSQFCLRTAMPVLPYRKPRILDSIHMLPAIFKEEKITSVLLITDAGIRKYGLTRELEYLMLKNGILCPARAGRAGNPLYPFPILIDEFQMQKLYRQISNDYRGVRMEEIA